MVRSLYSGVSGLKSHQTRMDVIGNNIANVNTYGYKASRTSFSDIYYQYQRTETGGRANYAGNNPSQVGYGVQVASIDKDMSMSSFQNTGRTLDLAIAGDGMFMCATLDMNKKINSVTYTRMGNFGIDSVGNLVNANNEFIIGTRNNARTTGNSSFDYSTNEMVNIDPEDNPNDLEYLNINDLVWDAYKPSCQIEFDDVAAKYKSAAAAQQFGTATPGTPIVTVFTGVNPYDDKVNIAYDYHMATAFPAGTGYNATEITPPNVATARAEGTDVFGSTASDNATIFDTDADILDNAATVTVDTPLNVKSDYILYSVNGNLVNQQGVIYDPQVGLYTDEKGNYYDYTCTTTLKGDGTIEKSHVYTLMNYDDTTEQYTKSTRPEDAYKYDDVTETFSTTDSRGNTIYANMTDGALKYSDLDGFTIGADGIITAQYASKMCALARIELATFDNIEGLTEIGDTEFAQSSASGAARVKRPGDSGAGKVQSSKLEMSNVNLANEFSDMIVTQRGYQANARIITTSDSMLEELVNLKR